MNCYVNNDKYGDLKYTPHVVEGLSVFLSYLIQQPWVRYLKPGMVSNCKSSTWVAEAVKEFYAYCQSISNTELLTVASQAIVSSLL